MAEVRSPSLSKADLEQRYISLLEERVQQLELAVKSFETAAAPKNVGAGVRDLNGDNTVKEDVNTDPGVTDKSRVENLSEAPLVRVIVSKWDPNKREQVETDVTGKSRILDKNRHDLTYREYTPDDPKDGYHELIDINKHSTFRALLKEATQGYPNLNLDADVFQLRSPFYALIHNWSELLKAATPHDGDDDDKSKARNSLRTVLDLIESSEGLTPYFTLRESYLSARLVSFHTLWAVFVPGSFIVAKPFLKEPQIFKIISGPSYVSFNDDEIRRHVVECSGYDFDGNDFVEVSYEILIEKFQGTKEITDLPCYPITHAAEGGETLRQLLLTQGLQFFAAMTGQKGAQKMRQYQGEALVGHRNGIREDPDDKISAWQDRYFRAMNKRDKTTDVIIHESTKARMHIDGKVVLDHGAYQRFGNGNIHLGDLEAYDVTKVDDFPRGEIQRALENATDGSTLPSRVAEYLQLLPPRHLGYFPKEKIWGQYRTASISPPPSASGILFDQHLQLDQKNKSLIMALIQNHATKGKPYIKDSVAQAGLSSKGKGLVLLFHGSPGVGKTMTAESIAEATGKPLILASVAEIGLDPEKAERNLEQMFMLAAAWEAILLVDEADVFLEARSRVGDTSRNALVSVLLRVLEYYEGIIILTTNRIGIIDVAVLSRIHLAIRYDQLNPTQRQAIFKQYLDQLEEDEPCSIRDRKVIDSWIEDAGRNEDLNGRQIRNLVQAAFAAARRKDKDAQLEKRDLLDVNIIYRDFVRGLRNTITNSRREQVDIIQN